MNRPDFADDIASRQISHFSPIPEGREPARLICGRLLWCAGHRRTNISIDGGDVKTDKAIFKTTAEMPPVEIDERAPKLTTRPAPAQYSRGEEIANSISHGVGWLLSVCGLAILVTYAAITGGALRVASCAVFGSTLVLLYAASTLYHALREERAKKVMRVFDHSAIFLLIAGTYTPLALVAVGGAWGWSLFATIWALATIGVLLNTFAHGRWRWLSITLYITMGWLVVIAIRPLVAAVDARTLVLIVAGGVTYTLGLAFYGWRRLPYGHSVWHLFVLAGSALHYLAIFFEVGIPS